MVFAARAQHASFWRIVPNGGLYCRGANYAVVVLIDRERTGRHLHADVVFFFQISRYQYQLPESGINLACFRMWLEA